MWNKLFPVQNYFLDIKWDYDFNFANKLTYDESKSGWYVKEGPTISITGVVCLIPMSRCKEKIPGRLVQPVCHQSSENLSQNPYGQFKERHSINFVMSCDQICYQMTISIQESLI